MDGNSLPQNEEGNWQQFVSEARSALLRGKTGARKETLLLKLLPQTKKGLAPGQIQDIIKLLISTVPRYTDRPSRHAVLAVLKGTILAELSPAAPSSQLENGTNGHDEIFKQDKGITVGLIRWLEAEVARTDHKGSTTCRFTLLTWATLIYVTAGKDSKTLVSHHWASLVRSMSILFDQCINPIITTKASMRHSALVLARRATRQNPHRIPDLIDLLILEKATPCFRHASLLGLAIDISIRLKGFKRETIPDDEHVTNARVSALVFLLVVQTLTSTLQSSINTYYISNVLGSKVVPPQQVLIALGGFWSAVASSEEFENIYVPNFEKALILRPETALPALSAFFQYATISSDGRLKLITAVLSSTKSSIASTRSASVLAGSTILSATPSEQDLISLLEQVHAPLKASKTSSADHRAALYSIMVSAPKSATISVPICEWVLALLPKESSDLVVAVILEVLAKHLPQKLESGSSIAPSQIQILLKGMQEPKPSTRKIFNTGVGNILWTLSSSQSNTDEASSAFAVGMIPGLLNALKTMSNSALTAPAGPIEGYVAVAVLLGRLKSWNVEDIDQTISSNPTLQTLSTSGLKSSFLLWDKVYRKISTQEEEAWLLRALESLITVEEVKFSKDMSLRLSFSNALLHFLTESHFYGTRQNVTEFLSRFNQKSPKLAHQLFREGLRHWLLQSEKAKTPVKISPLEDQEVVVDKGPRLRAMLHVLAKFGEAVPLVVRRELIAELLVVSHHPRLGSTRSGLWVDLLQQAGVAPETLIQEKTDTLFDLLWSDACTTPTSLQFAEASYRAATTLAFIAPAIVVPRLFSQFEDDLSVVRLRRIGSLEFGVWATPPDTTFVDVLSSAKTKTSAVKKNSKEHQLELWEAELREALARKRPAAATLSKTDQQLLEKQLATEASIRQKVAVTLGRLRRGFSLLLSLVESRVELVRRYLAAMINDMLQIIALRPISLVASEAFTTFQALGDICSDRLGFTKVALGVAVLRSLEAEIVPTHYCVEPLPALVTRILHRLRFLADQSAFDAGTFAYAAPLVSRVLRGGGVGLDKTDVEAVLEQLTLALDFIAFHARQCADAAYPRLAMIEDLLATLVSHPTLSRTATAALSDIGEAIKDTATPAETQAILKGAMVEEIYVRFACMQALLPFDLTEMEFPPELWIACHDCDDRTRQIAAEIWEENGLDVPVGFFPTLLPFLAHHSSAIRMATAASIREGLAQHTSLVGESIQLLIREYKEKSRELLPEYDQYGMVIEESLSVEDPWKTRVALATTFRFISEQFSPKDVDAFFDLLTTGEALGDRSQAVRTEMLEAAIQTIDKHGKDNLQALIKLFEEYLARPGTGDAVQDHITESLVILFGRLARHLDPTDPRIKTVIGRLVEALRTPSEVVQAAVCDCLPPLVKIIKDDVPDLVDQLLCELFEAPKYAERRGAAYGLAGVVKGRGISSLKEFDILSRLRDNAEDKKSSQARQGAVFAYEVLATVLGRLFEPYIQEILPVLLACFGDTSRDVREATADAAKAIMGKLTGHAIKLILPTLQEGLDDKQWRAKKGAIELMGAMAFLAPRQLSVSLPAILPRLTETLTDTHKQVREAANGSLKRFGEVVTNPEIQEMQSILLDALVDPSKKTPRALDALLGTTFAHFIDSSSLALIIPIIDRGLRERSADVKRKASAIVGNMATITDAKDLIPYLSQLVPLLRGVLIDPVPEARSTAAKSLGGLVERLGENNFPDLIDALMAVLKSPSSGVDQQGAAQGVSEILAGLGVERLEGLLPTILANCSSPRSYVREGHISLLIFLPVTFGDKFSPYLGRIIQPLLGGLADDSDYVREASMRAGRMIVANHSTKAIDLLLPELELGLFDQSWRIRQSSVQLVGDLLFRLTGITGKVDEDEDGEEDREEALASTDSSKKALIETLGKDRRDRVLSALYIVRQDNVGVVRQAAIGVWKALVQNTPRTVRDMLPTLMQILVRILASPGFEQRETAARCLADTCRKLGEAVLGEVISILQKAMGSPERRQREGVCLALSEIMANTSKSQLEDHEDAVVEIVRGALVDTDPTVRTAAANAFDVAQQVIGPRSIDETLPTLLDALQHPGETADAALAALKEVMQVRAEKIFPVLIPRLLATPITAFNARALASLVRVAGSALGRRLTNIVDVLNESLGKEKDEETAQQIDEALTAVLASVVDHDSGLSSLQMHTLSLSKSESPSKRVTGCMLFARFCQATTADFSDYSVDWIRQLVSLFDDKVPEVVGAAWYALDILVKKTEKEDLEPLVVPLRRTIENVGYPGVPVDGFSRPNGLKPILPILLQGLLAGTGEQREQAAYGLGDLVERTSPEAFKTYCIQTVGPLIRVIGDRFPAPIKSAILSTLTVLLTRVPQYVKPFFPQLQRTFLKSLTDATSLSVRNRGATALGVLMNHQPRVDPLVNELTNLVSTEEGDVRDSVVNGLAQSVASGGANLSEPSKSAILDILSEAFAETNKESYNIAIARLLAALTLHAEELVTPIINAYILGDLPSTMLSSLSLRELIESAPAFLYKLNADEAVARVVRNTGPSNPPTIARPARETRELMKQREPWASDEDVQSKL